MKKISKTKNILNKGFNFINPEIEYEYYQHVGDQIVSRKEKSKHILIDVNHKYLFSWGIGFFILGFVFLYYLFGDGPSYNRKINIVTVSMLMAITSPFFIVGIRYFYRAWKAKRWLIDLDKKLFILGLKNSIPFENIVSFYLTSLQSAGLYSQSKSYHLNIKLTNGKSIALFRSDDSYQIQLVANYLKACTKISTHIHFELA